MYLPPPHLDAGELHIFGLEPHEGHYMAQAFVALRDFAEGHTFTADEVRWRLLHDVVGQNAVQFMTIHLAID